MAPAATAYVASAHAQAASSGRRVARQRRVRRPARRKARSAAPKATSAFIGGRLARVRRTVVAIATAALLVVAAAGAAAPADHALLALNILPPGEGANTPDLTSQISMYDGLTPLQGNVTAKDLTHYYKQETLGLGGVKPRSTVRPKSGGRIYRDPFGVPHVYGTTRANSEFAAGWGTAADRG